MDIHEAALELGRRGGNKGGRARSIALSAERRSEIASHAAKKRWGQISVPLNSDENENDWLAKARGAMELIKYHDAVCPDYPLRDWLRDVILIHERMR